MATIRKNIEKKWLDNFKKSPLVDKDTLLFQSHYARQLFYGRQNETYPSEYPHDFTGFYHAYHSYALPFAVDRLLEYMHFIGIKMGREPILNHLAIFPGDYPKLIRKSYYILKTLAHHADRLNINNPYQDNNGDIFFCYG